MDSFDIKLFEIMSKRFHLENVNSIASHPDIENEVQKRIQKVLDKYFIFTPKDRNDKESENRYLKRLFMYTVNSLGEIVTATYSANYECYLLEDSLSPISWDKLFVTEKEVVDSITKHRRRK